MLVITWGLVEQRLNFLAILEAREKVNRLNNHLTVPQKYIFQFGVTPQNAYIVLKDASKVYLKHCFSYQEINAKR